MINVARNAYGYNITIDAGFDISTATTLTLNCKPRYGGSLKTITCSSASTTTVTAPVTQDFFNRLGYWDCQLVASFASADRVGDKFIVNVEAQVA